MKKDHAKKALSNWLSSRVKNWQHLEKNLSTRSSDCNDALETAREILAGFRSVQSDLSLAHRNMPGHPLTRYLESLFIKCHEAIYQPPRHYLSQIKDLYNIEVPQLMRQMLNPILATLVIFTLSILAGWFLISFFPNLVTLFASPEMINHVQSGKLWTDDLLNIMPSSVVSLDIITNNITVSLFAFTLGALYGLGTLYIIAMNGLMLGGVFAFTAQYNLDDRLFKFIIGHGVVELSVIIIAGAMGLRLGEALIRPGNNNRLQAFQQITLNAGKVMLAAVPFLILAGLIEGFISPNNQFSLMTRILVGIISGLFLWYTLLFGLPLKNKPTLQGI